MTFAAAGDLDLCEQLVNAKAQIGPTDNFRCNAIHYAQVFGHNKIETYLQSVTPTISLGMKPGQDVNKLILDAVMGGCCGALMLARESLQETDPQRFEDALKQTIGPFENTLFILPWM
jgi:hypothetical protein